jgi:hypothetical protein
MLPEPGDVICAGLDMGLKRDSAALAVVYQRSGVSYLADLLEIRPTPGRHLKPSEVVRTFAETMKRHTCSMAMADGHYSESVREVLDEYNFDLIPAPSDPAAAYVRVRALMREGRVRIPKHDKLIRQLRATQGVPTVGGRVSIQHPRNAGGHGDLVAAMVLAFYQSVGDQVAEAGPDRGTDEWAREQRRIAHNAEAEKPWWQQHGEQDRGEGAWWRI